MTDSQNDPGCMFCPQNGQVDVVADIGPMYLVRAKDETTMADLLDRWLIIPAEHIESPTDLPLGWGEMLVELTHSTGLDINYNWALNVGPKAGQTRPHLHWWMLDRSTDDLGKGMSWMIGEVQRLPRICQQLQAENQRLRQLLEQREFARSHDLATCGLPH